MIQQEVKMKRNSPFVHLDRDAVDLAGDLIVHVPALQEVPDEGTKADIEMDECL